LIKAFPFAAVRPNLTLIHEVVANPKQADAELKEFVATHPNSILHIIKPYLHFPLATLNLPEHFPIARTHLESMLERKVLEKDDQEYIYIYKQSYPGGESFEGVVLGISIDDYLQGRIKKHENTITHKEDALVNYLDKVGVVGEPVLLSNPNELFFSEWMHNFDERPADMDFTDLSGRRHQVWTVSEEKGIQDLQLSLEKTNCLYIADGHHRIAAISHFLDEMRTNEKWEAERMILMAFVLPESELTIKPFHRILKGMNIESLTALPENLQRDFIIEKSLTPVTPEKKGEICYLGPQGWFKITLKPGHAHPSPVENLDVSQLEDLIFQNWLGILDSKTDDRLSFLNGDVSLEELEKQYKEEGWDAVFVLYPNTMREIKEVADAGETMPPKSTWIEPKFLSGMLLQQFR
jgi:uncharacterized protein (DUF1015 family)